jgi:hypothetical protein
LEWEISQSSVIKFSCGVGGRSESGNTTVVLNTLVGGVGGEVSIRTAPVGCIVEGSTLTVPGSLLAVEVLTHGEHWNFTKFIKSFTSGWSSLRIGYDITSRVHWELFIVVLHMVKNPSLIGSISVDT